MWILGKQYAHETNIQQFSRADYYLDSYLGSLKSKHLISTSALTSDFGFKRAVALAEPATINSMLESHLKRVDLGAMVILNIQGAPIAGEINLLSKQTLNTIFYLLKGKSQHAVVGWFDSNKLMIISLMPVNGPHLTGYALSMQEITESTLEHLKSITGLEYTIKTSSKLNLSLSTIDDKTFIMDIKNSFYDENRIWSHNHYISVEKKLGRLPPFMATLIISSDLSPFYERFHHFVLQLIKLSLGLIFAVFLFSYFLSKRLFQSIETFQQNLLNKATYDGLTKLYNRSSSLEKAKLLLRQSQKSKDYFSIAMLDIDHFKAINDNYGHDAGDIVLSSIAERVKNALRENDIIGRLGGEEFIICCAEPVEIVHNSLIRVKKVISAEPINYEGKKITVTVSIGCYFISVDKDLDIANVETLLKKADSNLYRAKQQGRNQVVISYHSESDELITETFL